MVATFHTTARRHAGCLTRALRRLATLLMLACTVATTAHAQDVTLNLINVDIESAVRTIAQATGRATPDNAVTLEADAKGKWGYDSRDGRNWREPGQR